MEGQDFHAKTKEKLSWMPDRARQQTENCRPVFVSGINPGGRFG